MEVLEKYHPLNSSVPNTEHAALTRTQNAHTRRNHSSTPIIPLFPDLANDGNNSLLMKSGEKLEEMRFALRKAEWLDVLFAGYESVLLLSKLLLLTRKKYISSEKALIDQAFEVVKDIQLMEYPEYERLTLQTTVAIHPSEIFKYAQAVESFFVKVMDWKSKNED